MQTVKAELMKAVANPANKVAHKGAGKGKTQWIDVCFVVVIVCLAFLAGDQHAWGQAYQKMLVEEVVAEWAFTSEGQEAYELAQAGPGNIKRLARCEGKGWYKKSDETGTACIPASDKEGTLSGGRCLDRPSSSVPILHWQQPSCPYPGINPAPAAVAGARRPVIS